MASYTREDLQYRGMEPLLRLLIDAAENGKKITYKRVAEFLEKELQIPKVFSTHIGGVAGTLMNRLLEIDAKLPLINLLVVSSSDQVPGVGANWYLKHHFGRKARFDDDDRTGRRRL